MSNFPIVDLMIILFGVMLAWVFAWKAHHSYTYEHYKEFAFYTFMVVMLLIAVVAEAIRPIQ